MHLFATLTPEKVLAEPEGEAPGPPESASRSRGELAMKPCQLPRYPSLYQINTRVWLTELSAALGRPATLDDIPDAELDRLAEMGFDWVWLLSVWQTGRGEQAISRANPGVATRVRGDAAGPAATRTSPARVSRSPTTPCIATWAAMRRSRVCAQRLQSAACA